MQLTENMSLIVLPVYTKYRKLCTSQSILACYVETHFLLNFLPTSQLACEHCEARLNVFKVLTWKKDWNWNEETADGADSSPGRLAKVFVRPEN